jgi:glycosyl transferase family 25
LQIFVINLDRHPMRWQRMAGLLQGLAFKRIPAVDGKTLDGPELNDLSRPRCYETVSRYHRACGLSHRAAWQEFLASGELYGCVFEDDVFLSPDFPRFISDETWIPPSCDLFKIETTLQPVFVSRKNITCLDRMAAALCSLHCGAGGYIISRRGAQALLSATSRPARAIDCIMYDKAGLRQLHPVYQLFPALCVQASQRPDGMVFPEMASSIQLNVPPKLQPEIIPGSKTRLEKIKREIFRPFLKMKTSAQSAGRPALDRLRGVRRVRVPFA